MNTVKVRNIMIGEGLPKIVVPIVATNKEEIIKEAKVVISKPVDIIEWRMDWFENVFDFDALIDTLKTLREIVNDTPILATFRSTNEGGQKAIGFEKYIDLNTEILKSGLVDMIDVEISMGDEVVKRIIDEAHKEKVFVVSSKHDFDKTPSKQEIIDSLEKMQDLNADILKIAVMPKSYEDVFTLLNVTKEFSSVADKPIVTMSMSSLGVISRITGEAFGSCMTFGAASKTSAPGQMKVEDLKEILNLLHDAI